MSKENTIVLTRKIQVFIDCDELEQKRAYYKMIYLWQNLCFRAANYIFTHQYIQDQLKEFLYLKDEFKVKLTNYLQGQEGIFNTSRMNTTYRLLSEKYKGILPSDIFSNLNNTLIKHYNSEKQDYWKGVKSLRNYKRNIPIPFSARSIRFKVNENSHNFKFSLFKIPFQTYLGKDKTDKKMLLQRVIKGSLKMCSSSLKIDKNKIYLIVSFEMEKDNHVLDKNIIAEADLSLEFPITVKIGADHYQIGNKEEYLHRRLAIQSARQRLLKGATYNRGGNGRKRKLKSLVDYAQKEKNYVNNKLHNYSKRLIELCVRYQVGTILLVNQDQKEKFAREEGFILRNWSFYGLKEKIYYKAEKAGIYIIEE
ncbi:transposase [Sphingobacteriaceae bacterium WQ 2009]|uniref:Transposase n=1 Tax=Rhinopithecimicrobium faecis TaxID=2820698 RepID=A0A8T4HAI2_9SPHI|nr:transposase [Sphingobacteriaceae bacterium WQ 2009]